MIAPVFNASPEGLVLRKAQSDNIGDQHFRFRQVKNGRDVLGGEIVVHVRKGVIYAANGRARDDLDAPLSPVIDSSAAIEAALDASRTEHRDAKDSDDGVDGDIQASKTAPLVYKLGLDRMDLVYQVEVQGVRTDQTPFRDSVLVNAIDGNIVGRMPHIHTAKSRTLYNLNNGTILPGTLARTEGQAANADSVVNDNYDRLGTTYDCYLALFNRDSYNGGGAAMKSSVHYSTNYVNAYRDGNQMVYGDGDGVNASNLARSMDVTAHELTHAVTENESNLVYAGESGGLNEAMSDIFGNTCEWYRDGQVVSANTWKVGEDIWTPATAGDALRYMNDPILDGGSLDFWTTSAGTVDVHYSSGIANLAFYLLSQGGLHPRGKSTVNVTGIGIAKAAQIFYRANRDIMTSISDFAAAKAATEQAAVQLGYSAAEQASVTAAWKAVGVGIPAPPPVALTNGVPVTGIGTATNTQKFYSLTVPAGATGLSFTTSGGTGDVDLYVRFGSSPTLTAYDCRPYINGSAETCTISAAQAGTYYVMLNAYATFSGVTLTGAYTGGGSGGTDHLVINEVEYDEVGTDDGEFVEIYNGTGAAVSLSGYSLVLVNGGTNTTYLTQSLSGAGTLAAGQYLVVGNSSVTPAAVRGDDEQACRTAMDRARDRHVRRPAEALPRGDRELDLDNQHQDGNVGVEQDDDDISAVFGGLNLSQVDRGEARFRVGRESNAQRLDKELGGERGAVLEEIHQDLVGHGGHDGKVRTRTGRGATWWRISQRRSCGSVLLWLVRPERAQDVRQMRVFLVRHHLHVELTLPAIDIGLRGILHQSIVRVRGAAEGRKVEAEGHVEVARIIDAIADQQERIALQQVAHDLLVAIVPRGLVVLLAGHHHRLLSVGGAVDLEEHLVPSLDTRECTVGLLPGVDTPGRAFGVLQQLIIIRRDQHADTKIHERAVDIAARGVIGAENSFERDLVLPCGSQLDFDGVQVSEHCFERAMCMREDGPAEVNLGLTHHALLKRLIEQAVGKLSPGGKGAAGFLRRC